MSSPTEDPAARPLRWIGAIAVLGVVSAALAVLAWEAIDESVTFIGDASTRADTIVLATEGAAADDAAPESSEPTVVEDAEGAGETDVRPPATYEVQPGDTGTSIARDLFGEQAAWADIAAFNDIPESATLTVGQVLRIPDR